MFEENELRDIYHLACTQLITLTRESYDVDFLESIECLALSLQTFIRSIRDFFQKSLAPQTINTHLVTIKESAAKKTTALEATLQVDLFDLRRDFSRELGELAEKIPSPPEKNILIATWAKIYEIKIIKKVGQGKIANIEETKKSAKKKSAAIEKIKELTQSKIDEKIMELINFLASQPLECIVFLSALKKHPIISEFITTFEKIKTNNANHQEKLKAVKKIINLDTTISELDFIINKFNPLMEIKKSIIKLIENNKEDKSKNPCSVTRFMADAEKLTRELSDLFTTNMQAELQRPDIQDSIENLQEQLQKIKAKIEESTQKILNADELSINDMIDNLSRYMKSNSIILPALKGVCDYNNNQKCLLALTKYLKENFPWRATLIKSLENFQKTYAILFYKINEYEEAYKNLAEKNISLIQAISPETEGNNTNNNNNSDKVVQETSHKASDSDPIFLTYDAFAKRHSGLNRLMHVTNGTFSLENYIRTIRERIKNKKAEITDKQIHPTISNASVLIPAKPVPTTSIPEIIINNDNAGAEHSSSKTLMKYQAEEEIPLLAEKKSSCCLII